ncbi:MAG: branched-chain amino acid ABC transporter permease [Alphaproteobacteria bacterium]|nr:branched-chain amino acid ABC transporter permease [Alphaproteobacteria bacterium]
MLLVLLINILIVGAGYGLIAIAFAVMSSVSPFFNLTLGSIIAFGAYGTYGLTEYAHLPMAVAIVISIAFCACAAALLERFVYTPLRTRGASSMVLLVASLGLYTIFEASIHLAFGPQYQILGGALGQNMNLGIFSMPKVQFITIVADFIVFGLVNLLLFHTFFGKMVRALNDSAKLANITGLNNNKIILIVSMLSGLILGLSGVLTGFDTGLEPTMGFNLLFKGMIGAIIGGSGSLYGPFLGAFFLAAAENVGVMLWASEWRDLVAFVIFIIFLIFRPQGIFQRKEK